VSFLRRLASRGLGDGGGEFDESSRLDVVKIARVPDILPSLFHSGRAKDLSAPWYADSRVSKILVD